MKNANVLKFYLMLAVLSVCTWSGEVQAVLIQQKFSGVQLNVVGEYINGVPVDTSLWESAPSFQQAQTISGFIAYDTDQPDYDPGPYGTYRIGTLSVDIPDIGLNALRSSSNMQISAFDNTPNPDDQFFAYVNGVDSFTSNVGLPNPASFSISLFGSTSMLANDLLPTNQIDWTFGNSNFDFLASDGSWRQVLITFEPDPFVTPDFSGWVFMPPDAPDFGYSLNEGDLLYFYSSDIVLSFNLATGGWIPDKPVAWIYVDWPFYYVLDPVGSWFALPPADGLWVYHFSTSEWTVSPRIIP